MKLPIDIDFDFVYSNLTMDNNTQITKDNLINNVKVTEAECWEWLGTVSHNGYGYYQGHLAHRFVYTLFNGEIPNFNGKTGVIRHSCDNRCCVNPKHLSAGTSRDNIKDMLDRGRSTVNKGKTALTNEEVEQVKIDRFEHKMTYQQIADKFDKAVGTIHEIINGRNKSEPVQGSPRQYRSLMTKKSTENLVVKERSSKYRGVSKVKNSYVANYRGNYLGSFAEAIDAAVAYDKAAYEDRGADATTNRSLGLIPEISLERLGFKKPDPVKELYQASLREAEKLHWSLQAKVRNLKEQLALVEDECKNAETAVRDITAVLDEKYYKAS